jgi:hypothetical protein
VCLGSVWVFPEGGNFPSLETTLSTKKETPRDYATCSSIFPAVDFGVSSLLFSLINERCSSRMAHRGAASSMVSQHLSFEARANAPQAITLRSKWSCCNSFLLRNNVLPGLSKFDGQRQPYSSSRPQEASRVPTTIRKSTSVVEHVLCVLSFFLYQTLRDGS